ncbi:phosphodiester glycosidase family protein [Branchiibius cervicis]|uniref:Phosphodiester glycosidase family protein n=1 Tax=Branchiibius cervicis TaxID=908252 RepID=A0ABW2AQB1_9MICO
MTVRRPFVSMFSAALLALFTPGLTGPPAVAHAEPARSAATGATSHAEPGSTTHAAPDSVHLAGSGSVYTQQRRTAIAPGLDLTSFQRLESGGWVTGHVMTADLRTPSLSMDLADGGTVSAANDTVSSFATDAHAVAAVNGDYFDMNASDAPVGTDISPTAGVRTLGGAAAPALTLAGGRAAITNLTSAADVTIDGKRIQVDAVNSPTWHTGQIGVFTPLWGSFPVGRFLAAAERVRVVHVRDGRITAVEDDADALSAPAAAGETLIVGRGAAANRLSAAATGHGVHVTLRANAAVSLAVGGSQVLIKDGRATGAQQVAAARTAVGVSKDGTRLWIVSVDGRVADSPGQTLEQLTALLLDQGAWQALNLDGGGSTTLVARPAGTSALQLIDRPSDGTERKVTNALVFRSSARGPSSGVAVRTALDPAAGLAVSGSHDLLPGLSRTIVATGLAADYSATAPRGRFLPTGSVVRTVGGDRRGQLVVEAARPGSATVRYLTQAGHRSGQSQVDLRVHGPLMRLEPSSELVTLDADSASAPLSVSALDADGFRVPVETRDIRVSAGPGLRVQPSSTAGLTVTATAPGTQQASSVTLTVLGRSLTVPVAIGAQEKVLSGFEDAASWTGTTARATGNVTPTSGHDGSAGLRLDFDFTQSTATRGMFANPPAPIAVPGQPKALTLWINGTGKGEWPRLQVTRGDGTVTNLDGDHVDWTGWRKVTFPVPAGTSYPLTLTALRFMEIRSDASYTDQLAVSDLRAVLPPDVAQPPSSWRADPALISQGDVDSRPLRVAVLSDTQFVARDGADGPVVQAGRRALREIVAARPDQLFIVGDFVDEASPADFALAKAVLDQEVTGKVPWTYVPGNHEVMGGPLSNFTSVFGPTTTHRVIDHTAFITLDSSSGTLHPGGTDQLQMLEQQLSAAAADRSVTGVVVLHHHPIVDPQPDKASQLTDRVEAAALQRTLAQFRSRTGKSVADVNGHVGIFFTDSDAGVTRVINGNSGKSPSGTPAQGGFTGWSMLGIDPAAGRVGGTPAPGTARTRWLQVQTHARVDSLSLQAPVAVRVGGSGTVSATITQDGDRKVPVTWPVTATWGGDGVRVGSDRDRHAVLRLDPATGAITGLRPGTATLTVTVNGAHAAARVTVR